MPWQLAVRVWQSFRDSNTKKSSVSTTNTGSFLNLGYMMDDSDFDDDFTDVSESYRSSGGRNSDQFDYGLSSESRL